MKRRKGCWVALVAVLLLAGAVGCGKSTTETPPQTAAAAPAEKAPAAQPETAPAKTEPTPAPTNTPAPSPGAPKREPERAPGANVSTAALLPKTVGTQSAPITIEVFSDYQCPACRELYLSTLKPLIDNYVLTGKVYLIHRDMPLSIHQYSRIAARYGNAAAQVHELEKVSDALFQKQMQWSIDGNVERVVADALTPAEMRQVKQLVESGKMDAVIESDVARGRIFSVRQTPTMVITHNGRSDPVVGAVPYSLLRQYLDELLKK